MVVRVCRYCVPCVRIDWRYCCLCALERADTAPMDRHSYKVLIGVLLDFWRDCIRALHVSKMREESWMRSSVMSVKAV